MSLRFTFLLTAAVITTTGLPAQDCASMNLAFSDIDLVVSSSGTLNRSGVAFHQVFRLYYSVNAGSNSYPIDTYNDEGNLLFSPSQGFDYRGVWFNPNASSIEGNGFSTAGIFIHNIDINTGEPLGSGATVLPANQPSPQSNGDMDVADNLLIYYSDSAIYRYNRMTNNAVDTIQLTNLPVDPSALNDNTVLYTGCANQEYAVYDMMNKRVLYIDKATGEYNGATQLPVTAPEAGAFNLSYANNRLWVFDRGNRTWKSYFVTDAFTSVDEPGRLDAEFSFYPNPTQDLLQVRSSEQLSEPLQVDLISVSGQLLSTTVFRDNTELSLRDIPIGTYFIRVVGTKSGKVSLTQAIMKQ